MRSECCQSGINIGPKWGHINPQPRLHRTAIDGRGLSELLIVEPKKHGRNAEEDSSSQVTRACLNLDVVQNLLGNYTRPISLRLLQRLSERGVLFESYISGVLSRRPQITKDVFELWTELGLSIEGYGYGSRLASKMRKDLDKMGYVRKTCNR